MRLQYVHHIGQHGHRLAVTCTLSNHLQRKVQAFLQPGGIDDTQHMADIGVIQRTLEVVNRNALIL